MKKSFKHRFLLIPVHNPKSFTNIFPYWQIRVSACCHCDHSWSNRWSLTVYQLWPTTTQHVTPSHVSMVNSNTWCNLLSISLAPYFPQCLSMLSFNCINILLFIILFYILYIVFYYYFLFFFDIWPYILIVYIIECTCCCDDLYKYSLSIYLSESESELIKLHFILYLSDYISICCCPEFVFPLICLSFTDPNLQYLAALQETQFLQHGNIIWLGNRFYAVQNKSSIRSMTGRYMIDS